MAYRIAYQSQKNRVEKGSRIRLPVLVISFFFLFLAIVETKWQEGAVWLNNHLLLLDRAVAASALNTLTEELQLGKSFFAAFADFVCNLTT